MNKRTFNFILGVIIAIMAVALLVEKASAETQPDEQYYDARCKAAANAFDYPSITVFCLSAAENHGTDADSEVGNEKAADLVLEAGYLVFVGMAHKNIGDADPAPLYHEATDLLHQAKHITTDPTLLRMINEWLRRYPSVLQ